ncbi:MAG: cyclic lactone autoinducer peptide [Lachnospiraceae bacterium]|jgi:cyclic lactone autoinducer peptide|nr:cyclic lactone autoinducer peptide [Lachnospiraceae bacterium]
MKNMEKCKALYTKLVVKMAYKAAETEVNTTCPFYGFQPEVPDAVKKLSRLKK